MNKTTWQFYLYALFMIISFAPKAWGLTITEPLPNTVYHPGDRVVVKAEPASGENIKAVWFSTSFMPNSQIVAMAPFVFSFTVNDFIGIEKIRASAKMVDGSFAEAEVDIKIALPAGTHLQSVKVPDHIFISKLPAGSDPNRVILFETRNLPVSGRYSNGYELDIHSVSDGTTYTSSDVNIVTVDVDGKLTAHSVGTANITVTNGVFKATTKVIVKSKNR